jgi:hypothetical protein
VDPEVHPGCKVFELQGRMNASKAKKEAFKKSIYDIVDRLHLVFPTSINVPEHTAFIFPVNNFLGML